MRGFSVSPCACHSVGPLSLPRVLLRTDHLQVPSGRRLGVCHELHGLSLHAGEHVLADGHGESRGAMSEPLRDNLDRHAGRDQKRRVSVPEIVQADLGELFCLAGERLEGAREVAGVQSRAVPQGEHQPMRGPLSRPLLPLVVLLGFPCLIAASVSLSISTCRRPVEVFGLLSHVSARDCDTCALHRDGACV
jgi:hypothetical protein